MQIPARRCQAEAGANARPAAAATRTRLPLRALAVLAAVLLSGYAFGPSDAISGDSAVGQDDALEGAASADWLQFSDPTLGLSLSYPPDWTVDGLVVATQFSAGARCRSVRIVDFEPPPDSGAAAPLEHSYVQVCARPLAEGVSLDAYMQQTYGESLARRFAKTDLNGTRAYRSRGQGTSLVIYAQSGAGLVQIVTGVTAAPEHQASRRAQVERILGGLTLS